MTVTKDLMENLPELAEGYFWRVSAHPRLDAIDQRPEIRVSLRKSAWVFPRFGHILAEAWFLPETTHVPDEVSTSDIVRELSEGLLARQNDAAQIRAH